MICPICGNECKLNICLACGFDASTDTELYPTIAFTSAHKASKSAVIRRRYTEMFRKIKEMEGRIASLESNMEAVLEKLGNIDASKTVPEQDDYILVVKTNPEPEIKLSAPLNIDAKLGDGDVVAFGRYPQNTDSSDQDEIKWIVLSISDKYALLISEYVLDYRAFYGNEVCSAPNIWEESSLRKWLNGEFYENAFNKREQDRILPTDISGTNYEKPTIPCDDDTMDNTDNVFLLNVEDYKKHSKTLISSECKLTPYARKLSGDIGNNMSWWQWWLRSAGENVGTAICVDSKGSIVTVGHLSKYLRGIRPAIFVRL